MLNQTRNKPRAPWLAVLALCLVGCTAESDDTERYTYSGSPPDACYDLADVVGKATERCGEDYQTNYDSFIGAAAGGSCENITAVRDVVVLYDDCIPWLQAASCEALFDTSRIPQSCARQLQQ